MAWPRQLWRMVAQALIAEKVAVVVNPCSHHPRAQRDVFHRFKLGHKACDILSRWCAIELAAIYSRAPAPKRILLHEEHFRARESRCFGRLQACKPAADNCDIRKEIEVLICISIARLGRLAKAR